MSKPLSILPTPQFPTHYEPRVWLLSSGASPIGIALSRQLLAHGDSVVFGRAPKELSDANSYRAVDFATFWEEEVLVKEGWKDRAKMIGLDGRCEVTLFHNLPRPPTDGDARGVGTWANVKLLLRTLLHPSESSTFLSAAPAKASALQLHRKYPRR